MERMRRVRRVVATLTGFRSVQDDRVLGRLRSRRWRMGLVALQLMGWLAVAAGFLGARPPLVWAGLAASGVALLLLVLATRNVASSLDPYLDERERWQRDRAYRWAYWIMLLPSVSGLAVLWGRAWSGRGAELLARLGDDAIAAGASLLILLYAALPSVVLAFQEPDPPPD